MSDIQKIENLINIIGSKHNLDKCDLVNLLTCDYPEKIYIAANRVRQKYVGKDVHLRGLIEFSNYCGNNCFYCGLRAANGKIKRYKMEHDEIIKCAKYAVSCGLKTIVLQSGEDKSFTKDEICKIVSEIKNMDVAVTLSIGELPKEDYSDLKKAGADRYLLRIETTNKKLYESFHPGMSHANRLKCLYNLQELGYETGTGCLIGLPGQTVEMLAEDLMFFKNMNADMLGMGPFIPCGDTPLMDEEGGNVEMVLKMISLARLLMPDINIPATTALGVKDNDGYRKGLSCGANVIMPNMGMPEYKRLYSIYPGKGEGITNLENQMNTIKSAVFSLDRSIGKDYGSRKQVIRA